ncbi:MAG: DUF4037 domain-containing protein [Anaerolineales bacterium]|nr:DUF4037 domain-containing protein [Anaerolineales bacterium]
MTESIIDVSRDFFNEIVKPILEREFPAETAQAAFGVFGYGSEVLRLDDEYSSDHHWGLRINALVPEEICQERCDEIIQVVGANLPATYRGHPLREGYTGIGLAMGSLEAFLRRTIGLNHAPETYAEWLNVPEEEVQHLIGGEVWHDPSGRFSAIRQKFNAYYPEPVWLRRIAHWCRYFSGMGVYAVKRALLRNNELFATIAFARSIRLGVQLAFLLDKQYFPYDKWLLAYFERLPRLAAPLHPIVAEAVHLSTPWERKLELLHQLSDVLDTTMVADGLIAPHPKFAVSPTSGYRLLEHAYAQILQGLPADLIPLVPVWDQIYLEQFHSGYVAGLDLAAWDKLLNLEAAEEMQ